MQQWSTKLPYFFLSTWIGLFLIRFAARMQAGAKVLRSFPIFYFRYWTIPSVYCYDPAWHDIQAFNNGLAMQGSIMSLLPPSIFGWIFVLLAVVVSLNFFVSTPMFQNLKNK